MEIHYLLTLVNKTKEEIVEILKSINISGTILIGNQLSSDDSEFNIKTPFYHARVFNMKNKGVSRNRNFLTAKSNADYITYLDDDMYFDVGFQKKIEQMLLDNQHNAVRFNVTSDNRNRPIKYLRKKGFVGFRQLSSYGVCGIFFKRQFLLENNILFREDIGPGTNINHGEDALFNKDFLRYSKIYSIPELAFHAKETESTWRGDNRNIDLEAFSHGYVYQLLYPHCPHLMVSIFLLTHIKHYPRNLKRTILIKRMFEGIEAAKFKTKNSIL